MLTVRPLRPSPAYLAISQGISRRDSSITARKLLILDLNGTILLRPKPRPTKNKTNTRPVHPRPYMPSFKSFLFHDTVKPWLDVRVWSSAQPHSVNAMVERCFGNQMLELQAVWARDTLGLSPEDYWRKVPVTKDLNEHWDARLGIAQHSAETTLLLDDSPLKAQLQPYNHVCVPEYTPNLRNRDLLNKENGSTGHNSFDIPSKRLDSLFDQTLIAVIGILDEVREQTNVAGWIRAGGLWAGREPPRSPTVSRLLEMAYEMDRDRARPTVSTVTEMMSDTKIEATGSASPSNISEPAKEPPTPPGNDAEAGEGDAPIWFENEPSYEYWVDRGARVLNSLGIKLDHGVVR